MEKRSIILCLLLLICCISTINAAKSYKEEKEEWREEEETEKISFLLKHSEHVVKTDAGNMRVVKGASGKFTDRPMHVGFITMEPRTLFIPQYLDSSLILFVRRGEAKIGFIHKEKLAELRLKMGDIYRISAGSTFYLVNTGEGQRLHAICSIDPSESLKMGPLQSFFVGGGRNPTSILAGFEQETLASAFNVTVEEVREILTRQDGGAILFLDSRSPRSLAWRKFLKLEAEERLQKMMIPGGDSQSSWLWSKIWISLFAESNKKEEDKSPKAYNIYDRQPDFKNDYGWSIALEESDFPALKNSGIGIYLVNLTAGSMMAPHLNPTATEYGVVLRGSGSIEIVYPNGTQAVNAKVTEGDVFWVPRYYPFCQIATRSGPFEFFGFTTSARTNHPQFLAGSSSVLRTLRGPELAAAFVWDEEKVRRFTEAQREAVILPSAFASLPDTNNGGFQRQLIGF